MVQEEHTRGIAIVVMVTVTAMVVVGAAYPQKKIKWQVEVFENKIPDLIIEK